MGLLFLYFMCIHVYLYPRKRGLKGVYWNQPVMRSVVVPLVGLSAKSIPLYSSFSFYLIDLILGINVNQE